MSVSLYFSKYKVSLWSSGVDAIMAKLQERFKPACILGRKSSKSFFFSENFKIHKKEFKPLYDFSIAALLYVGKAVWLPNMG